MAMAYELARDIVDRERYFAKPHDRDENDDPGYGDDPGEQSACRTPRRVLPIPKPKEDEQTTFFMSGGLEPSAVLIDSDYAVFKAAVGDRDSEDEIIGEVDGEPYFRSDRRIEEPLAPESVELRTPVPPKPRSRPQKVPAENGSASGGERKPNSRRVATESRDADSRIPKAPRTNMAGGPTAFDGALATAASPEDREKMMRIRQEFGFADDDYIWNVVKLLGVTQAVYGDLPDRIEASVDDVIVRVKQEIALAASEINEESIVQRVTAGVIEEVSRGVKETIVPRLFGKQLDFRLRWGAAGAAIAGVLTVGSLAVGIFAGMGIASNHYEMQYEARVAAIPHLSNEVNTVVGRLTLDLIRKNSEAALRNIVECRSDAGLILERSKSGERVCVGEKHAKAGWRLP